MSVSPAEVTAGIRHRVKESIVTALELEIQPSQIGDDVQLFAPEADGGLGLDSLAALEIYVVLVKEFDLPDREIVVENFATVALLADWVSAA